MHNPDTSTKPKQTSEETGTSSTSLSDALGLVETMKMNFQTLEHMRNISALLEKYFADKPNIITGINALMLNAIEHGNLNIGFDLKGKLLEKNQWMEEIEKRLSEPAYARKKAELTITRKDQGIYAIIQDEGNGFDWSKYLSVTPTRSGKKHGRGIALAASLSFDKLTYNDKGNQAIGFIGKNTEIDW